MQSNALLRKRAGVLMITVTPASSSRMRKELLGEVLVLDWLHAAHLPCTPPLHTTALTDVMPLICWAIVPPA